jgi:DNA invertase Pin-like site-specific DNA recombinase
MAPTTQSPVPSVVGQAIVYLRVSKEDRRGAKVTATIENQGERAEAYCQAHGLEVVEVIIDEDVSAEIPFFQRKGGRRVLQLLRASEPKASALKKGQRLGAPGHLVIAKQDRLCRNVNDLTTWLPEARDAGIALHLTEEGGRQNLHDPNAMMVLQMKASMAEAERNAISIRTKALMGWHGRKGRFLGHVPYGQRLTADGKHLEPEPREAAALEIIRKSTAKHDEALAKRDAIDRQLLALEDQYRAAWSAAIAKACEIIQPKGTKLAELFERGQAADAPMHGPHACARLRALFAAADFSDEQLAYLQTDKGLDELEAFEKDWRKLEMLERSLVASFAALDKTKRELRKAHRELTKTKKAEGSANLARRLKAMGKNAPPRLQWSTRVVDAIRERFRSKTA